TVQVGTKTFKTSARTRIVRNGNVASLDSVAGQDDITAHIDDSSGDADDIQCDGPDEGEAEGVITAVDTTAGTMTFQDSQGNSITVSVTADTFIEFDNGSGVLSDLVAGMNVEVYYDPTTFVAFRIEAENNDQDAEIDG